LIAFEGVDGAGKSTALRFTAERLRAQGVKLCLPRVGKTHASRPTQMIRELTRDPHNFELSARAELLLYCAREAQVMSELVRPALERGETVLVDRSFLTPIVLGRARGLSAEECERTARLASAGVEPDLTLVFDVHPRTSRLRKRIERIRNHSLGEGGRKGLLGSAFKERVREHYARIAHERGHPILHVERATPLDLAARVVRLLQHGANANTGETPLDLEPRWRCAERCDLVSALEDLPLAEALFLGDGLIATRALRARALAEEPALTAYTLDADDPLREAAAELEPEFALRGLRGKPLSGPDDIRLRTIARAPRAALLALRGLHDDASDALRREHAFREPDALLSSLAFRDDASAWRLRELVWKLSRDEARATSLIGCRDRRSAELRAQLFASHPLLALKSLRGTRSRRGDDWLSSMHAHAPKAVLQALVGRVDPFAQRMRAELFETGREVIDSVRRQADEAAFALRERALTRWPSTVAHSLLGLPDSPRVRAIYERCAALGARDLHVLRRLWLLDEQASQPMWKRSSNAAPEASEFE
jgi:dTMP kinase